MTFQRHRKGFLVGWEVQDNIEWAPLCILAIYRCGFANNYHAQMTCMYIRNTQDKRLNTSWHPIGFSLQPWPWSSEPLGKLVLNSQLGHWEHLSRLCVKQTTSLLDTKANSKLCDRHVTMHGISLTAFSHLHVCYQECSTEGHAAEDNIKDTDLR